MCVIIISHQCLAFTRGVGGRGEDAGEGSVSAAEGKGSVVKGRGKIKPRGRLP